MKMRGRKLNNEVFSLHESVKQDTLYKETKEIVFLFPFSFTGEKWVYSNFLKSRKIHELMPKSSKIVVFDTRLNVSKINTNS